MRLYPKLAILGIQKNRRLYIPYLLTCIGMVAMFYILQSLSYSPLLQEMKGGNNVGLVLSLGKYVISVFSLIFLIYTNSFLNRRRNKEFGLYHILGMGKRGLLRISAWESLFISAVGMVGGIALGIALSKLAELGLLNAIHVAPDYRFTMHFESIKVTIGIFAIIFVFLFLKSMLHILRAKPLELMHSEQTGEKPPKANWLFAVLGLLLLGGAYYLAVSIQSPLKALTLFFVAVIMVILGTYLLFCAGSVTLCRTLQKNKRYYYQKQHFVSVSSMTYRMRRNGAGLASICVLSTMVLVMLSSASSLFIGAEGCPAGWLPRDGIIAVHSRKP